MKNAMPSNPVLYLLEPNAMQRQRLESIGGTLGCRVHADGATVGAFASLCRVRPDVIVIGSDLPTAELAGLCRQIRANAALQACHLLFCGNVTVPSVLVGIMDDLLRLDAPDYEVVLRLQSGIRQSQVRRQATAVQHELEQVRGEQERAGDYMTETTTHLVEIAAQLQSEVVHSVEREEESVRVAQQNTIAQAAAALRHEINNPLFAIVGSAESAIKRLEAMQSAPQPDVIPIITSFERILRGADRIQQVVQAISEMLTPATTEYIEGVSMLNLPKTAAPTSLPS